MSIKKIILGFAILLQLSFSFDIISVLAPLYINSIIPSRDQIRPPVDIPKAITKFYPLPQETVLNSYSIGNSYLVSGQFAEAVREFDRAIDVSPKSPDLYISRGIAKEKLLQWQSAIDDYKQANTLYKNRLFPFGKDDATAFSNIANAETGLEQWTQALKDFEYATKLDKDFVAPQIGEALVLHQLGRVEESKQMFSDLIDKYPLFADGQAAYAVILNAETENGQKGQSKEDILEHWKVVMEQDSRYSDVEWVRDYRRWPPSLVQQLSKFLKTL